MFTLVSHHSMILTVYVDQNIHSATTTFDDYTTQKVSLGHRRPVEE